MKLTGEALEKQNERKIERRSFVIALLLHLIIFFFLSFTFFEEKIKKDDQIITVQLASHRTGQATQSSRSSSSRKSTTKTSSEAKKHSDSEVLKSEKNLQKENQRTDITESKRTNESNREIEVEPEIEIDNDDTQNDYKQAEEDFNRTEEEQSLIEQYQQQQEEEKSRAEEEFFSDSKQNDNTEENLNDLDIDSLFGNTDGSGEDGNEHEGSDKDDNSGSEGDIKWDGTIRGLVSSPPITVPDKFSHEGLKYTLTFRFTVVADGFISSVDIVKSSTNVELDEHVKEQFRKWVFEKAKGNSTAEITLYIGY